MRPFWRGFFSVFDLFGTLFTQEHPKYRRPATPEEARRLDRDAIRSDWEVVGNDLRHAMEQFPHEPTYLEGDDRLARRRGGH